MRHLYFDIDGTILREDRFEVKSALGEGRFQQLIELGQFDRVFCVSNLINTINVSREECATVDGLEIIYRYCCGAFSSENWVRTHVELISDPLRRVDAIDFDSDWWYVDDLAAYYFEQAGQMTVYREQAAERVCEPEDCGTGDDIVLWFEAEVAGFRRGRSD